jgi:two-component system, chemotaxis family, protein-glutamate methylesterase/glutaminase
MTLAGAKTSVLIVDDSALLRRALRELLESDPSFSVIGEAATGKEGVRRAQELRPRLITMDLDMPDGNGIEAIEQIMAFAPTRIMVITGVPRFSGQNTTFEALSRGALEVVAKPTAYPATAAEGANILLLAKRLSSIPVLLHTKAARERREASSLGRPAPSETKRSVVAVGASTGGPAVLRAIISALPSGFSAPIIVVQHLADVFADGFIKWLGADAQVKVQEALPGIRLVPGTVFIGVRGTHVAVTRGGTIRAVTGRSGDGHCPSVDILFESVATEFGAGALGVLLTGMGKDGASGLRAIRDAGGLTIAQDERTSVVFGMPKAAIELGAACHVASTQEIMSLLIEIGAP